MQGKPTLRKLTSQHPYTEMYIGNIVFWVIFMLFWHILILGYPHVRSVHMDDLEGVKSIIQDVLNSKDEVSSLFGNVYSR